MPTFPKIAIIYLSYHCEPYIEDVISSLKKLTYPHDRVEFVIIDNPHPTHGPSVKYLEDHVLPLSGKEIPHTTILAQSENIGFSAGNNIGIEWAQKNGLEYVYLHNNDGFLAATALEPLVHAMEADDTLGATQSLMLLHPDTERVNSTGNSYHYLGFGYCDGYRKRVGELSLPAIQDIGYASGAAVMMRTSLLSEYGNWDEDFFLYHEDTEYSLRLRIIGKRIALVRDSVFYHKYQFSRSITKYYWMERNRFAILLMFYKMPTLILLFPIGLALEVGQWAFAFKKGWANEKWKVYAYWLQRKNRKKWWQKRSVIQSIRTISDRELMEKAVSTIEYQEKAMNSPLLKYIGNPLMRLYYTIIVKGLLWW